MNTLDASRDVKFSPDSGDHALSEYTRAAVLVNCKLYILTVSPTCVSGPTLTR